jgi:hypothetical protein
METRGTKKLTYVAAWLRSHGREFPLPDGEGGTVSLAAFERAGIPVLVSCTQCMMTMPCGPALPCDEEGQLYCFSCTEGMEI